MENVPIMFWLLLSCKIDIDHSGLPNAADPPENSGGSVLIGANKIVC